MRFKITGRCIGLLCFCLLFFQSCSTDKLPLSTQSSLPQTELSYYSDSFDSLKDDLWDPAGFVFSSAQLGSIKIGEMSIEAGKLRIETKTGGFSKAGLVSKFALRGDYTVQIDLQIDFIPIEFDMDQVFGIGAVEKSAIGDFDRFISIGLNKKANSANKYLFSGYRSRGNRYHTGFSRQIKNFNGSVRMIRIGDQVVTYFRETNQNRWSKMCTLPSSQKDTFIGFALQNFTSDRMSIEAHRSIRAWIDNFKIIAAHEIIESEI